jgi:hypothetical protein
MKHWFRLILLACISSTGFAQMNSSWDIIAGVDYSNRFLYASHSSGLQGRLPDLNKYYQGKINWRLGANYNKKISGNTYFKSGMRLASVGYVYKTDDVQWGTEHNGMGGYEPDPDLESVRFSYDYWFIELPIAIRFFKPNGKFSPFLEVGISPSLYLASLLTKKIDTPKEIVFRRENELVRINNLQLVGTFAFGANYNYSDKLQFFAQPTFRLHLTQLFRTPLKTYLYSAGLEMGFRWRH